MEIRITKPCHENWDLMKPSGAGRYCEVCKKVVKDHAKAGASLSEEDDGQCGNLYVFQLGQPKGLAKIYLGLWNTGSRSILKRTCILLLGVLMFISACGRHNKVVRGRMRVMNKKNDKGYSCSIQ
ncbi:MAG TPA: hypothetical protein VI112_01000 [Bacteroidia bacterium]|jgi:hypothetical protein